VVKLPEGEDENEWLAVNSTRHPRRIPAGKAYADWVAVVDFYNQINLLYGAITEFCSPQSCPEMKATDEYVLEHAGFRSHADGPGLNTCGRIPRTTSDRPRCRHRRTLSS
jgi:hypothetical protein